MRRTRLQHPCCSARGRLRPAKRAQTAACPGPEALSQLREERAPARLPAPPRLPAGRVGGQRCRLAAPGRPGSGCIPPTLRPRALSGRHLLARGRASFSSGRGTCNLPPRAAPQVARRSKLLAKLLRKDRPSPQVSPLTCEGESGAPCTFASSTPAAAGAAAAQLLPGSAPRPPPALAAAAAAAGRRR
ncbi:specifically androgen-regulated gene protein-like [Pteropus medius]|uniref:specifically androgen-regulated gene protein-like n=1 Tax=Pteropus vampyrus TaxID=132908 RepID=UPI00196B6F29|nr:specifically androgen-regulated gene protein-like [Pteropus giganteus]XP_039736653.1 specifically androgen-regulated gene protein-like [Pteropus giganteus]XP_039736654.1 specifically androgen-regulated gene protein-like [Pteropus giganteus]XP_039736655.1 specifically androgen-regulated gene protein-like [Pteropus giganteus]XP_039736656.1 specifically androgen-regulated gene protein-like [Pteropus giganteus]